MVDLAESTGIDPLLLGEEACSVLCRKTYQPLLRSASEIHFFRGNDYRDTARRLCSKQCDYQLSRQGQSGRHKSLVSEPIMITTLSLTTRSSFETIGPQYQELPRFLKRINYQNVSDPQHSVFQDAWKTNLGAFDWFQYHPENLEYFNQYMASRREGAETWLSVYPIEEETVSWDPEAAVFVNMGGGIGHQCAEFRARYPKVAGRVILQDLPHSIDRALQSPGVENMTHNFFERQPIIGISTLNGIVISILICE